MKYKVGDKVWLRDDLKVDECYGSRYWNNTMLTNKIVTIEDCIDTIHLYYVKEGLCGYTDEMIDHEKTTELNRQKVKVKPISLSQASTYKTSTPITPVKPDAEYTLYDYLPKQVLNNKEQQSLIKLIEHLKQITKEFELTLENIKKIQEE